MDFQSNWHNFALHYYGDMEQTQNGYKQTMLNKKAPEFQPIRGLLSI